MAKHNWESWADDGWDHETGAPDIDLMGNAIQVYTMMREGGSSVAEVSDAFNLEARLVIEAVQHHSWMFLSRPSDDYSKLMIEHEGE